MSCLCGHGEYCRHCSPYYDPDRDVEALMLKMEAIRMLVDLPKKTQVPSDWRPGWLLDAIEKVLRGEPVLLGDGKVLVAAPPWERTKPQT